MSLGLQKVKTNSQERPTYVAQTSDLSKGEIRRDAATTVWVSQNQRESGSTVTRDEEGIVYFEETECEEVFQNGVESESQQFVIQDDPDASEDLDEAEESNGQNSTLVKRLSKSSKEPYDS